MENTLKIKVFRKSILFCKYLRKESLDLYEIFSFSYKIIMNYQQNSVHTHTKGQKHEFFHSCFHLVGACPCTNFKKMDKRTSVPDYKVLSSLSKKQIEQEANSSYGSACMICLGCFSLFRAGVRNSPFISLS